MKVLFIGGTGRLSKDTVARSVALGHEVSLLTRGTKSRNAFILPGTEMLVGNINDPQSVKAALQGKTFDVVADYLAFNPDQLRSHLDMLGGICSQYVFVSSATAYKRSDEDELVSESSTPLGNDNWRYALDKYRCELALQEHYANHDGSYTIVRPYVTYGNTRVPYPIVPTNSLHEWTFVDRVMRGGSIPVFDGADRETTLTHTRDFAVGMAGLFGNDLALNEDFHITSEPSTKWTDVLDVIEKKTGVELVRVPMSQEELYDELPEYKSILLGDKGTTWRFDNSKIKRAVPEFECAVSVEDGVTEMVDFYQSHPELQVIDYEWNGKVDRLCAKRGLAAMDTDGWSAEALKAYRSGKSSLQAGVKSFARRLKNKVKR